MPKLPPTQIVVHRIEFQQKEREVLESLAASLTVRNLAEPAVALLSDTTALVALAGILEMAGVTDIIPDNFDPLAFTGLDHALSALDEAIDLAGDLKDAVEDLPGEVAEVISEANPITGAKRKLAQSWVLLKWLAATAASQVPSIHPPNIVR